MSDSESPAVQTVYLAVPATAKARFKAHLIEQNGGDNVSRDRLKKEWETIASRPARTVYTIPELKELVDFYTKTNQPEKAASAEKRLTKERVFESGGDAAVVASEAVSKRMTISSVLADGWKRAETGGKKHSFVHESGAVCNAIVFKSAEVREAFNSRKRKAHADALNGDGKKSKTRNASASGEEKKKRSPTPYNKFVAEHTKGTNDTPKMDLSQAAKLWRERKAAAKAEAAV